MYMYFVEELIQLKCGKEANVLNYKYYSSIVCYIGGIPTKNTVTRLYFAHHIFINKIYNGIATPLLCNAIMPTSSVLKSKNLLMNSTPSLLFFAIDACL